MKTDESFHDSHADKLLLPNALLLEEIEKTLAHGQSVLLKTSGNSMLPFIVGGRDSVLLQRHDEKDPLQVGQIVLAHLPDNRYVLHRIIHIHETEITMMGDGNLQETEHCQSSDIVGIVAKILRNGRYVDNKTPLERHKAKAWMQMLPMRRYLLYIYKQI